jgi:hypothetical protein
MNTTAQAIENWCDFFDKIIEWMLKIQSKQCDHSLFKDKKILLKNFNNIKVNPTSNMPLLQACETAFNTIQQWKKMSDVGTIRTYKILYEQLNDCLYHLTGKHHLSQCNLRKAILALYLLSIEDPNAPNRLLPLNDMQVSISFKELLSALKNCSNSLHCSKDERLWGSICQTLLERANLCITQYFNYIKWLSGQHDNNLNTLFFKNPVMNHLEPNHIVKLQEICLCLKEALQEKLSGNMHYLMIHVSIYEIFFNQYILPIDEPSIKTEYENKMFKL